MPTPSTTPAPSGNGVWVFGQDSGGNYVLMRVAGNLTPRNAITGSNTQLNAAVSGLAVDPSTGNVWVLVTSYLPGFGIQGTFNMYPPTATGNVAPSATTVAAYFPAPPSFNHNVVRGIALDGNGNAFAAEYTNLSGPCSIWRVPLTGGTVSPVQGDDCSDISASNASPQGHGLQSDRGFLYYGLGNPNFGTLAGPVAIVRYTIGSGGALARNAIMTFKGDPADFGLDNADDVLAISTAPSSTGLGVFAASNFVPGQTTTAAGPSDVFPGVQTPVAVDAGGNVYATQVSGGSGHLVLIPSGSHGVFASSGFSPVFIAPAH